MTPIDIAPFIAMLACITAMSFMISQNRYIRKFRQAGAVSPSDSKPLPELKLRDTRVFRVLVRRGVIEEAGQDRWYLDQQRAAELGALRRRIGMPSIAVATIGVGLVWALVHLG